MAWLQELFSGTTIASTVVVIGLAATLGLALGSVRVYNVRIGIAGVLFSGLLFGHFGVTFHPEVLEFAREFGLILFVYTVGLQIGPGFFGSLRREGLPLNVLAAGVVLLGGALTVVLIFAGGIEVPVAVGLFSGATTNTPSLAAAQAALQDLPSYTDDVGKLPGLGYAVAYPFGICGILLVMIALRAILRIDMRAEEQAYRAQAESTAAPVLRVNLVVENANLDGMRIGDVAQFDDLGVVISRIRHGDKVDVATKDTVLHMGDVVLAVGPKRKLRALRVLVGPETDVDIRSLPSQVSSRELVVTKKGVLGESIRSLAFRERHGVQFTRVRRSGIDLPVTAALKLQYGDTVTVVGPGSEIDRVALKLGNEPKALNHPEVIPVFLGIALGVIVGSWPLTVPGVPAPVKLGLAGGPLLIAIIMSRVHRVGPLVWYMPDSANFMLREIGIVLFLACVGLKSGDQFVATLVQGDGLYWMAMGALVTVVPLLAMGLIGRVFVKINYLRICGLLAGSMTDPPALAFANSITDSNGPTLAYATVYPLTMILRVLVAQLIVLVFMS